MISLKLHAQLCNLLMAASFLSLAVIGCAALTVAVPLLTEAAKVACAAQAAANTRGDSAASRALGYMCVW